MTRPLITLPDFQRMLKEGPFEDDDPFQWFDRRGFDRRIPETLIAASGRGFVEILAGELLGEDPDSNAVENIAATLMLAGFALGWEVHEQFRGETG